MRKKLGSAKQVARSLGGLYHRLAMVVGIHMADHTKAVYLKN